MKSRNGMIALGLVGGMCLLAAPVFTASADQGQKEKHKHRDMGKSDQRDMKEMMPNEEEMMQAWMEYATPNEHHAKLEAWVGSWTLHTKMWMAPGAPVEESTMYSEATMMMGGRYLHERATGEFDMGGGHMMPFEGSGLIGYDNHKGEYFSHWFDNFGTGVLIETGKFNDKGQLVTKGKMYNPMFGKEMKSKSVVTIIDKNTRKIEMWMDFPGAGMHKHMEITYTRQ